MYPRTIKLENVKLEKLLKEKGDIIKTGITKSQEIESIEKEMAEIDEKIQEVEKTVNIDDLHQKEADITQEVQEAIAKMEEVKQEIYERMKEKAPNELIKRYEELKKAKEQAENDRNKIAIKAQKYTDKIIPLGKKLMTPHLNEKGDDYDSIKYEDGEIVCTIFNHFDDFEKQYDKNNLIK